MRTAETEPRAGARGDGSHREIERTFPMLLPLVAVAGLIGALYLGRYPRGDLFPTGWDINTYLWQTRALGHAPLSAIGARPGMPLLAAVLRAVVPIHAAREMVTLPPALALALGLAAAVAVRMAFRLPAWAVPVIAVFVASWPGTRRGVYGYEGVLTLEVLVVAGLALLVNARSRPATRLLAAALFLAACLSHVVFYALFVAIAGLATALALPSFVRDRRQGVAVLDTEAGATAMTVGAGGLVGLAALFGWLGIRPGETADVSRVSFLYRSRTIQAGHSVHSRLFFPVGAVGAALAWVGRGSSAGMALIRVAVSWLAIAAVAVTLSLAHVPVPGSRFIQTAVPLPVLFGLGAVAVGWIIGGGRSALWVAMAAVVVLLFALSPVEAGIRQGLDHRNVKRPTPAWAQVRAAAEYVARVPGSPPVVFVVDQAGPNGAYTPKFKLNLVRAGMPAESITRTFVYVGKVQNLEAGRPTLTRGTQRWQKDYNLISVRYWDDVKPALRRGAVVLIVKRLASRPFAEAVRRNDARLISPGLYLLRGPLISVGEVPPGPAFGIIRASLSSLAFLALLGVVGWPWTRLATPRSSGTWLDIAALAPAVGAGVIILPAFLVAAAGGDPSGPAGMATVVLLLLAGVVLAARMGALPIGPGRARAASREANGPA